MSSDQPLLQSVRKIPASEAALVFVHGFGGNVKKTWKDFPELLAAEGALSGWDIWCLGYHTGLSLDIVGIWTADPGIPILARFLGSQAKLDPLNRYKSLGLIAHSMGGLVAQAALISDPGLQSRTRFLFLFGTPSNGLEKASWFRFWKPQIEDMAEGSPFIAKLREDWAAQFAAHKPFKFCAIAGDIDQFVPPQSSLEPFPKEECWVISGNHLSIVKPEDAAHPGVQLVKNTLIGSAAPVGPWNSARVALEMSDFQEVIRQLEPHRTELDEAGMAALALAMEAMGRPRDGVIDYLEKSMRKEYTDVMGILAGRYKRRWIAGRRRADFDHAFELYSQAYDISVENKKHGQAFYHGINLAFLSFARDFDRSAAQKYAESVLDHCELARAGESPAKPDTWRLATEGEALLYLGHIGRAMDAYRAAVGTQPTPRQLDSMYQQAFLVTGFLGDEAAAVLLERIFRGGA
jgi:hypothetical protein